MREGDDGPLTHGDDLLGDRPPWQERARCREADPEAFFPDSGWPSEEAKRICDRCEVMTQCRDHALRHRERFGVWGGLSEWERQRMLRFGLNLRALRTS